jgi:hypothetical protein
MKNSKTIRLVRHFVLLTFLISTSFITIIYFSPSPGVIDGSILYGMAFSVFTLILLALVFVHAYKQNTNRRKYLISALLLIGNAVSVFVYFLIWEYALNTILIKITNNTGQAVTNAGISGCEAQNWGILENGESKTLRLPANVSCEFIVTYNLNGMVRHEVLPRKDFIKNYYNLGTHPNLGFHE